MHIEVLPLVRLSRSMQAIEKSEDVKGRGERGWGGLLAAGEL